MAMISDPVIRPATIADSATLARIQVDSYRLAYAGILPQPYLDQFSYAEQEGDWRDLLSAGLEDVLLVAESGTGELAGYALGRSGATDFPAYGSELVALHVRRPHVGRGIGRRLIAAVAGELQQRGCTAPMLWVLEGNPARVLYERLGGQMLGWKEWDGNVEFGLQVKEVAYGWPAIRQLSAP